MSAPLTLVDCGYRAGVLCTHADCVQRQAHPQQQQQHLLPRFDDAPIMAAPSHDDEKQAHQAPVPFRLVDCVQPGARAGITVCNHSECIERHDLLHPKPVAIQAPPFNGPLLVLPGAAAPEPPQLATASSSSLASRPIVAEKPLTLDPDVCVDQAAAEELTCAICTEICHQPLSLSCPHLYCEACLRAQPDPLNCPQCRTPLDLKDAVVNQFVVNRIENMQITCPKQVDRCIVKLTPGKDYRNIKAHVCELRPLTAVEIELQTAKEDVKTLRKLADELEKDGDALKHRNALLETQFKKSIEDTQEVEQQNEEYEKRIDDQERRLTECHQQAERQSKTIAAAQQMLQNQAGEIARLTAQVANLTAAAQAHHPFALSLPAGTVQLNVYFPGNHAAWTPSRVYRDQQLISLVNHPNMSGHRAYPMGMLKFWTGNGKDNSQ
jgi:hypothetical protein